MSTFTLASLDNVRNKGKAFNEASLQLTQVLKDLEPTRRTTIISNVPRRVFEDCKDVLDHSVAFELMCKCASIDRAHAEEIITTIKILSENQDVSPLKPYEKPERQAKREAITFIKDEAKNVDDPLHRELFSTPEQVVGQSVRRTSVKKKIIVSENPIDVDEGSSKEKEINVDQTEKPSATTTIDLTFRNPAVLYEVKYWDEVPEQVEDLVEALKTEFLVQSKAGSWEYIMSQHAVYITVQSWIAGTQIDVCQLLIDQFLLRLKLVMEGNTGGHVNNAMKKLQMNQMPQRYRNILSGTQSTKTPFGGQQSNQTQQQRGSFRGGRGRGNSQSDRVPPHVWAMLTPEQKTAAKAKPTA